MLYRSMIYIWDKNIYASFTIRVFPLFEINFTLLRFIRFDSQFAIAFNSHSNSRGIFFYLAARMSHVSYFTLDRRLLLSSLESTHESRKFMPVYEHDGNVRRKGEEKGTGMNGTAVQNEKLTINVLQQEFA